MRRKLALLCVLVVLCVYVVVQVVTRTSLGIPKLDHMPDDIRQLDALETW